MGTKLTNNATGRLAVSLTAASTQLSMVVGDAVKFPTIAAGSGDNFPLTAVKANGELEIMLCTLTNGNVFTVQRGQEGTSPKEFSAGDRIELRLTAGTIDGMIDDRIDAAIEVVLEDLGTAAYADLTTSLTGSNFGDVLKVGDSGLGSSIDFRNETSSNWTKGPPKDYLNKGFNCGFARRLDIGFGVGSDYGVLQAIGAYTDLTGGPGSAYAIFYSASGIEYKHNSGSLGSWTPVFKVYDSRNFPPVGFVYTQYPGEATPSALFGGTWSLLFNTEGIAFRTEGGNASSFGGGIQQDAYGSHSHSASSNSTGAHTHNTSGTAASAGGHSHSASTNRTGVHSHSGTTSSAGEHVHKISDRLGGNVSYSSVMWDGKGSNADTNTQSAGAHTHSLSINSGGEHSHTVYVDSGGAHTHSVSGTAASAGAHSHTITVSASGSNETRMINRTIRVWKRTA